jgi:succinate-semialdehyde dehydrogenase / glutarate-semialdehyde dehydrogenase
MTSDACSLLGAIPARAYVDGEWRPAAGAATFAVFDPATGEALAEVADTGSGDAVAALDAACAAQDAWAATSPRQRSEILRRAYELMIADRDRLAGLITAEMGKPLSESAGEVAYAADFFRWFAEEAVRIGGEYRTAPAGTARILTTRKPVGPCLLITPWNFPLAMITRKVAPALAAGCTTVVKPAEQTPLSALALAGLLAEAGLPPGVCNVIPTSRPAETVAALLADRRLRKLSFTGSTEIGRRLQAQASENLLRVSLELGGNAPFLVLADADIDQAVAGAMLAKLRNGGQSCVAANRFLVHESLADEFATKLAKRMAAVRVGPGTDPATDLGPLIDDHQRQQVAELVDDARAHGAGVSLGGERPDRPGYFYPPTVLVDVPGDAALNREEIFGPVAPIRALPHDADIIAAANDTGYGLVSYLYTRDLSAALAAIDALDCGMVGVNRGLVSDAAAPFGGVKHSGLGREGGREGITEYLSLTYASIGI